MRITLQLQAFNKYGKWCGNESLDCDVKLQKSEVDMVDAADVVLSKIASGCLPRHIYVINHPDGYPVLINHNRY